MTKKRRQFELPDYPEVLLRPLADNVNREQIASCLDAVVKHYGLGNDLSALMGHPFLKSTTPAKRFPWAKLALALLQDFVPAFRRPRRRNRDPRYRNAHEAWLVLMVEALQAKQKATGARPSRTGAFKRLTEMVKKQPAPGWRFGKMKVASLQQAWKQIDGDIKRRPNYYLPPKPLENSIPKFVVPISAGELSEGEWEWDFLTGDKTPLFHISPTQADKKFWESMPPLP